MEQAIKSEQSRIRLAPTAGLAISLGAALFNTAAQAQPSTGANLPQPGTAWQQCQAIRDDATARLQCFDQWATQQQPAPVAPATPAPAAPLPRVTFNIATPNVHDCQSREYSELSRFWELEAGSNCGTFGIRGFRPIGLSLNFADSVNTLPTTPSPGRTAAEPLDYNKVETRLQLSIRTKIAQSMLTQNEPLLRDSLWFNYSQQSNWQIFSGDLSRPFRTTDHEPEFTYIYPTDFLLPMGWRLRYSGISANHQSNGQALPLSRSWNRTILMMGMEKGDKYKLQARVWKRVREDAVNDDNPDISDLIGRAELSGYWNADQNNAFSATIRHSLRAKANGSVRLEWFRKLGDSGLPSNQSGLRLHTQLFTGFGDSLVDYNRRRTVLTVGLSLVDW